MNNMINLNNISKIYDSTEIKVTSLNDINLQVDRGEFLCITGPSGSGKTTLMNIIGCLDRPTNGSYFLEGHEVSSLDDDSLARLRNEKIGFVFQTFNLLHRATAEENVEIPLLLRGLTRTQGAALDSLKSVGLEKRAKHFPSELSGGENQRVAIARALIGKPPIILADEPTGNLDTKTGYEIMEIFKRLNKNGTTIIMVTHSSEVAKYASKVVNIKDGRI